jgi:hypothetical protein
MSIKKSSYLIGNRTRDLPACSIVLPGHCVWDLRFRHQNLQLREHSVVRTCRCLFEIVRAFSAVSESVSFLPRLRNHVLHFQLTWQFAAVNENERMLEHTERMC